uniref:Uncharacterized protein n=1 Tax=Arundo donax TaxID=35708 RepID=A0A0A9BPJ7_ARUDO
MLLAGGASAPEQARFIFLWCYLSCSLLYLGGVWS